MINNRYSEYTAKVINPVEKTFDYKTADKSVKAQLIKPLNYGSLNEKRSKPKAYSITEINTRKHLPSVTEVIYNIIKSIKIKPTSNVNINRSNFALVWSFGKFDVRLTLMRKDNACLAELSLGDDRFDIGIMQYSHKIYFDWKLNQNNNEWEDATNKVIASVKEYIYSAQTHHSHDHQFFIQNLHNFKKLIPEEFYVKYRGEAIIVKEPKTSNRRVISRTDINVPIEQIGTKFILPRDVIHDTQVTLYIYATIESQYVVKAHVDNLVHNSIVFIFDSIDLYNLHKLATMKKILNILAIARQNINPPTNRIINCRMYFDAVIAMMRTEKVLTEFDLVPANVYNEDTGLDIYEEKVYVHR